MNKKTKDFLGESYETLKETLQDIQIIASYKDEIKSMIQSKSYIRMTRSQIVKYMSCVYCAGLYMEYDGFYIHNLKDGFNFADPKEEITKEHLALCEKLEQYNKILAEMNCGSSEKDIGTIFSYETAIKQILKNKEYKDMAPEEMEELLGVVFSAGRQAKTLNRKMFSLDTLEKYGPEGRIKMMEIESRLREIGFQSEDDENFIE